MKVKFQGHEHFKVNANEEFELPFQVSDFTEEVVIQAQIDNTDLSLVQDGEVVEKFRCIYDPARPPIKLMIAGPPNTSTEANLQVTVEGNNNIELTIPIDWKSR